MQKMQQIIIDHHAAARFKKHSSSSVAFSDLRASLSLSAFYAGVPGRVTNCIFCTYSFRQCTILAPSEALAATKSVRECNNIIWKIIAFYGFFAHKMNMYIEHRYFFL